jgi:tellurite resistance protein
MHEPTPTLSASLPVVRPNAFVVPLGIMGLATVWRAMEQLYGWPGGVADALCLVAAFLSVVLGGLALARLVHEPRAVAREDLSDPVQAPFSVIPFIVVMLLGATGLAPHAKSAGDVLLAVGLIGCLLVGGWVVGGWMTGSIDQRRAHPGYLLPVLGPGLIGALAAGVLGHQDLGWMCLGLGLVGWLIIGSVIWHRLMFGPSLPTPLAATIAIQIAPAAVASTAYLALHGQRIDPFLLGLGGFCLLMVLAQVRLLPVYQRVPFFPNWWGFVFPWAAVTELAVRWLALEHPAGQRTYAALLTTAISAFVGAIAIASLVTIARYVNTARPHHQ